MTSLIQEYTLQHNLHGCHEGIWQVSLTGKNTLSFFPSFASGGKICVKSSTGVFLNFFY